MTVYVTGDVHGRAEYRVQPVYLQVLAAGPDPDAR